MRDTAIPTLSVKANPTCAIEVTLVALDVVVEKASAGFSTHTLPRSPPQIRPPQQVSPRPSWGLAPHSTAFSPIGLQFSSSCTSLPSVEAVVVVSHGLLIGRLVGAGARPVGAEVHLGVAGHEY